MTPVVTSSFVPLGILTRSYNILIESTKNTTKLLAFIQYYPLFGVIKLLLVAYSIKFQLRS